MTELERRIVKAQVAGNAERAKFLRTIATLEDQLHGHVDKKPVIDYLNLKRAQGMKPVVNSFNSTTEELVVSLQLPIALRHVVVEIVI